MSIFPDLNIWINTLVLAKLKDVCSSLDLNSKDRKVLDTCLLDLRNYIRYLQNTHLKVEEENPTEFVNSLSSMMITQEGIVYQNLQTTKETAEFIDMWVKMWWKKWMERTKVVVSNDQIPKNVVNAGSNGGESTLFSSEERDELLGITIMQLIKYGEICCTQILGVNLLNKAISDMKGKGLSDKLNLISKLQRQAKEISYVHGPLVFIKPDDNYFRLSEWRNFGTNNVIK